MKKVFFISTEHSVFQEPVRKAFQRAGFDVHVFDYRDHALLARDSILQKLFVRAPARAHTIGYAYAIERINARALREARQYQPDLIFAIKAKELDAETVTALGSIAPTANWYPETIDHWPGILNAAQQYHFLFSFDEIVIERLKERGCQAYYLPFCADTTQKDTWPQEHVTPEYNIAFVGTYHPERAAREHILARVADFGLHIWGSPEWLGTSLAKYYRGRISNDKMLEVYRSSKIVINHYITHLPGSGINLRPFEVTGAGALLMNHDARADIFKFFKDGEEFISFKSEDDIRDKVRYYMEHEDERKRIARQGFLRTQRDHTYDHRIARVLEVMKL